MLILEVYQTKIKVSFSFFAVMALIVLYQHAFTYNLLLALSCCIFHEFGHLFTMFLLSQVPDEIVIYGGGIRIKNRNNLISLKSELIILIAGCLLNLIIAFFSIVINQRISDFASANLFFGLFNLMPVKYFDGGRILAKLFNDAPITKIIRILFIILLLFIVIMMIIKGFFRISLIITFVYIIISEFCT